MTEINYDRGFLRFLSKPDFQGYQKLNAKYNTFDGLFEVELGINGTSGYFVFDTGNTVGVFLDSKMYQFNNPVEKLSYYTIMLGNQPVIMNSNLHLLLFKVGELQFKQYAAINSEKSHNNIGLKFIKQFNWILDEQNGFAYCKPIHPEQLRTDLEHKNRPNMANSAVINSKLIVAQMNYKDENFALGDEIISLNDTLVNSQNMCEISNKYNLEPDKRKLNVTYRRNIGPLD